MHSSSINKNINTLVEFANIRSTLEKNISRTIEDNIRRTDEIRSYSEDKMAVCQQAIQELANNKERQDWGQIETKEIYALMKALRWQKPSPEISAIVDNSLKSHGIEAFHCALESEDSETIVFFLSSPAYREELFKNQGIPTAFFTAFDLDALYMATEFSHEKTEEIFKALLKYPHIPKEFFNGKLMFHIIDAPELLGPVIEKMKQTGFTTDDFANFFGKEFQLQWEHPEVAEYMKQFFSEQEDFSILYEKAMKLRNTNRQ